MPHGKHLLLGATGLVKGRLGKIEIPLKRLESEFNQLIAEKDWLQSAPFDTIHYCFRFGDETDHVVYFQRISTKWQELPVASVLLMSDLRPIHLNPEKMYIWLRAELVRVLCAIQEKYNLTPLLNEPPVV